MAGDERFLTGWLTTFARDLGGKWLYICDGSEYGERGLCGYTVRGPTIVGCSGRGPPDLAGLWG